MLSWTGAITSTSPKLHVFDYVAASAKGFSAGEKSRFAYKKFMKDFTTHDPNFICLNYGQVDAEVGYYFRKYVTGSASSPEEDLHEVYRAYVNKVRHVLSDKSIVFKGLNPSTLRNETQLRNYVYRRLTARMTTEDERAKVWRNISDSEISVESHAKINCLANDILREAASSAGFSFFDIREIAGDASTPGLARWEFIPAESDVHLIDCLSIRKAYHSTLFKVIQT
ncbi:hypothetical protein [Paracoccus seriniphilus]|nr:hypothetical protein [Paracoccus seriniphilus]